MNAMAMDEDGGDHRSLRRPGRICVGGPSAVWGDGDRRFQEDGLRMFRGCGFAAQLGFTLEE